MTKIRALKDSSLAKQGEVFNLNDDGSLIVNNLTTNCFYISKEWLNKAISDVWFSMVEDRETLKDKIMRVSMGQYTYNDLVNVAREHAIDIVREADGEYNSARMMTGKAQYIIQKLDEKMR